MDIVPRKALELLFPKSVLKAVLASSLIVLAGVGAITILYFTPQLQVEIALYATERSEADTLSTLPRTQTSTSYAQEEDTATRTPSPQPTKRLSNTPSPENSPTPSSTIPASRTPTTTSTTTRTPTLYLPIYPTNTATQVIIPTSTRTRTLTAAPLPAGTPTPTSEYTPPATPPQPASATPTQPPTATPTSPIASCSSSGNSAYEATLLSLINQERNDHGLGSLTLRSPLTAAARIHSADMACNNFISHTGSDDSRPADRVAAQGYSFTWIGENIYCGGGSYNAPQQAFQWWMNSTPHRENILGANYQSIGIGYQYNPDGQYGGCFTLVFTRP